MEYILKGAVILKGENLELLENHSVWIKEGFIVDVIPQDKAPAHLETIDYSGFYMVPGLIDLHVHVMWDGSPDPVATHESDGYEQMIIRAVSNCQKYIENGITTVRDLGSIRDAALHVARGIDQGLFTGPRLIASGQTLTMTGGHDPFWGRFCDGQEEVVKGTREQIYKGAKVIKVSATGGVYGRETGEKVDSVELTYPELKAICEEAHRFGLKVASHAIGKEGIMNSIRAGVDTIEHGHFLDEEVLSIMLKKQVSWVPTLFIYQQIASKNDIPSYAKQKAEEIIERHEGAFKKYFDSGLLIGAGSDAGACHTLHPSIVEELLTMERFVSTRRDILKTATSNAGKIIGMNIGQIEKGYLADLILTKKDPLESIDNLKTVERVYKGGELVR
ncbi:amidohydrolase family protein [Halobacillus andaensis]|uniref:metal-dependent hydrolase family protein n=1 Tax=Halobacillus andaensis TaxID=1176239 RepID=UPI003D72A846